MKTTLTFQIECGETTCASEPGKFCQYVGVQGFGTKPICLLFRDSRAQPVRLWDSDGLYLHRSGVPLAQADLSSPDAPEHPLFGRGEDCDAGMCWI